MFIKICFDLIDKERHISIRQKDNPTEVGLEALNLEFYLLLDVLYSFFFAKSHARMLSKTIVFNKSIFAIKLKDGDIKISPSCGFEGLGNTLLCSK